MWLWNVGLASEIVDIPTITEVVNPGEVDLVASYVDILQVGARNVQNFALLKRLGRPDYPGMVDLIAADLAYKQSGGFGSLNVHRQLLLTQLDTSSSNYTLRF